MNSSGRAERQKGLRRALFYCLNNVRDAIICRQEQQEQVTEPELPQASHHQEPVPEQVQVPERVLQPVSGPPLSSGIQWSALRTEPLLK